MIPRTVKSKENFVQELEREIRLSGGTNLINERVHKNLKMTIHMVDYNFNQPITKSKI